MKQYITLRHLLLSCLLLVGPAISSEESKWSGPGPGGESWRREADFILHLMGRGELEESIFLLERMLPAADGRADSLHYLLGWAHYRQMQLDRSALHLLKVSPHSPVYYKSHFFGAYNQAHRGRLEESRQSLGRMEVPRHGLEHSMRNFQLGALALLSRDWDQFLEHEEHFSGRWHAMASEEERMRQHRDALLASPPRSPFVGGLLSAAVPGLGRVYAGKTGEGIISFLYVAALGFTTYDFYRGGGSRSPFFIASASVTGIFYLGNIAGSSTAVRRANNTFRDEMDQRILFDMHIPLRNAYP